MRLCWRRWRPWGWRTREGWRTRLWVPCYCHTRQSGPQISSSLDKFVFRFQSRIHVLEESRAFAIMHQKKQDWYAGLPAAARSQKQTNTRNKYRVNIGQADTPPSFLAPEVRSIHHGTRPEGTDQDTRRLSVHQVTRQDESLLEPF